MAYTMNLMFMMWTLSWMTCTICLGMKIEGVMWLGVIIPIVLQFLCLIIQIHNLNGTEVLKKIVVESQ